MLELGARNHKYQHTVNYSNELNEDPEHEGFVHDPMNIVEYQTFDEKYGDEYSYVYINTTLVEKHPTQCLSDN